MIWTMLIIGAIIGAVILVFALCRASAMGDEESFRLYERELHIKHLEDINAKK